MDRLVETHQALTLRKEEIDTALVSLEQEREDIVLKLGLLDDMVAKVMKSFEPADPIPSPPREGEKTMDHILLPLDEGQTEASLPAHHRLARQFFREACVYTEGIDPPPRVAGGQGDVWTLARAVHFRYCAYVAAHGGEGAKPMSQQGLTSQLKREYHTQYRKGQRKNKDKLLKLNAEEMAEDMDVTNTMLCQAQDRTVYRNMVLRNPIRHEEMYDFQVYLLQQQPPPEKRKRTRQQPVKKKLRRSTSMARDLVKAEEEDGEKCQEEEEEDEEEEDEEAEMENYDKFAQFIGLLNQHHSYYRVCEIDPWFRDFLKDTFGFVKANLSWQRVLEFLLTPCFLAPDAWGVEMKRREEEFLRPMLAPSHTQCDFCQGYHSCDHIVIGGQYIGGLCLARLRRFRHPIDFARTTAERYKAETFEAAPKYNFFVNYLQGVDRK